MKTTAKVIADSICESNEIRIVTLELSYHRFIHSEFMTHRVFSRNAASSRAIPVSTQLEQVVRDPAMPVYWGINKPGMQADKEADKIGRAAAESIWRTAAADAMQHALQLSKLGFHKQIVNRLLEPWRIMKVIVTATEWDNFFELRISKFAQPEIKVLAVAIFEAMDNSTSQELDDTKWHLPYVTEEEISEFNTKDLRDISAGRCARVSYLNHDKTQPDPKKDIDLASKLASAKHMSPFEHIAKPISGDPCPGITHYDMNARPWSGNFREWIQYRQLV